MGENCILRVSCRELRNLRPYKGGLPCPQLQLTCNGQVFATAQIPPGLNSHFDQAFAFPNLPVSDSFFAATSCLIVLYHTRERARTRLGEFEISLASVYEAERHTLKGKWCALVGTADKVAGYVLIDASLGTTGEAEKRGERVEGSEEDETAVLGMPENLVESYQLTVNVHKAENLPIYGVKNSISAFIEVLLGTKSVRTRVIPDNPWPQWREKLLLPTFVPSIVRFIRVRLVHLGRSRSEEVVDEILIDFATVSAARIPATWYHLYTGKYREVYGGRVLLSLSLEPSRSPVTASESGPIGEEPELTLYKLWLCVPEVAGLDFAGKLKIRVECGSFSFDSQYEDSNNRRWLWRDKSSFPQSTLELPSDPRQLPKLMLKVVTNSIEQREVCVALLCPDMRSVLEAGSYQKPLEWKRLMSLLDPKIVETKKALTGSINFSLNLMQHIRHSRRNNTEETSIPSEIWANVSQAKAIPSVYTSSLTEVYAQVSVLGVTKVTTSLKDSDNPQWNQVLKWRMNLPVKEKCLWVDVWDARPWPSENFLVGTAVIPDADVEVGTGGSPRLPVGKYYDLCKEGEVTGKVLVGIVGYPLKSREEKIATLPPAPISDIHKCTLQVLLLGTRKVKSFGPKLNFRPIIKVTAGPDLIQETTSSQRWLDSSENNHNVLETFEFPMLLHKSPDRSPCLTFRIYESSTYTRFLIGTVVLDLAAYLPWVPKVQIEEVPIAAVEATLEDLDEMEEKQEESLPIEEEKEEITDPYDGFFTDVHNLSKLNYHIDTSAIEVTDTTEALTAERELIPSEPRPWPGYTPQNYTRPLLPGPLERSFPLTPVYEVFQMRNGSDTKQSSVTGLLKGVVRVLEPRTARMVSLDSIKRDVLTTKHLSARIYFLALEQPPAIPVDSSILICCKTFEGDEKYRLQTEIVFLPNQSVELMTAVKMTLTLPDHAYVTIEVHVKTAEKMYLLGTTEIDVERRWFCRDFQEVRAPALRQVPVERRRLETGDDLVSRGELVMWMDLLTIDEATKCQPERLIPSSPNKYELRVVVWRVFELALEKAANLQVRVSVQDGDSVISADTDLHRNAEESAEFNWRCLFALNLPSAKCCCQVELFHVAGKGLRDSLGEVTIDFAGFYLEVLKEDEAKSLPKARFPLSSTAHELMGYIELEASLLSVDEAEESPAGAGRSDPNSEPFLPFPQSGRAHEEAEEEIQTLRKKDERAHRRLRVLLMAAACLVLVITVPIVLVGVGVI